MSKNLGRAGVVDNKHHETAASRRDRELVSGVKNPDQGVARMDYVTRVAFKAVSFLCLPFKFQFKGHRWRGEGG